MILSKDNLSLINTENVFAPNVKIFELPEKVLQFGTGVLLRGLPDYFIDKANREGVFNGRVAVVKSTGNNTSEFDQQDALYTLCVRGIENGQPVSENIISSAISRVIAAEKDWQAILEIAKSEQLQIVVSNTTEVGIQYVEESIDSNPPTSFPAKLLAVLYERFKAFNGDNSKGLVIIATELIPDNGTKLGEIVFKLAHHNQLEANFIAWLAQANTFCNSLVDRIVPGKPDVATFAALQEELGYEDNLLSMTEPYRLWAIEGGKHVADMLSFATVDEGVIIAEDIEIYRELKVRLLNGTHTLSSGIAFLLGIDTVKNAMSNELMSNYIETLMATEIGPAIPYEVDKKQNDAFANAVKDRFANPSIEHFWSSIAFQYTMKMKIRILPLLLNYYKIFNQVPAHIALGFAAYLAFSRPQREENGLYFGLDNGASYRLNDDSAPYLFEKYSQNPNDFVEQVLTDENIWNVNLNQLMGFIPEVTVLYTEIVNNGISSALAKLNVSQLKEA
ncbi:tagaturonate reductase [Pedobacter sp. SL55]|uniref:tagaturonate reductase n=1 Tax=Pedobacter sp. SL55 TaxID=2995161 RepID=UPI002270C087|nr:tagaturonate reductase [Pedobacter sp. SL55]WAC40042.1 tagaturonate reductase [Pedobacter sp. SL55]